MVGRPGPHQFSALPSEHADAIAPNFVHSLDASHLVFTLEKLRDLPLATVHDCVLVRAGDAQRVHTALLEAFRELYAVDRLAALHDELRTAYRVCQSTLSHEAVG